MKYASGKYIRMEKLKDVEMFNVGVYLSDILVCLSGRMVEIDIEDGKRIKFFADKSENVLGVYFVDGGNSCEVPKGVEQTVCKIDQLDCCIFFREGKGGFYCEKFNGLTARVLLDRLAKGNIAGRIGNCAILGSKNEEVIRVMP